MQPNPKQVVLSVPDIENLDIGLQVIDYNLQRYRIQSPDQMRKNNRVLRIARRSTPYDQRQRIRWCPRLNDTLQMRRAGSESSVQRSRCSKYRRRQNVSHVIHLAAHVENVEAAPAHKSPHCRKTSAKIVCIHYSCTMATTRAKKPLAQVV